MSFDRLILTQFETIASRGFSEYLILNALTTPDVNYAELGYGLDEFSNFFRIELVQSVGNLRNFSVKAVIGIY